MKAHATTYSVFVMFRNVRLRVSSGIVSAEEATARADGFCADRPHERARILIRAEDAGATTNDDRVASPDDGARATELRAAAREQRDAEPSSSR